MSSYVAAIWNCRYFWLSLVKMDLRTRYRRSVLGVGWSLLNPIAMTIVLCIVFSAMLGQEVRDYAPYLMAGLAPWNYFLTAALQGCQCFFQGESYIRQYPAPLAIYPLRTALGGIIHFFFALLVVLALAWSFHGFGNLSSLWSLLPAVLLLFIFAWSVAVLLGCANVHFQDTQHLTEVGFQILYFLTPIMYDPDQHIKNEQLAAVLKCNPLWYILKLIRDPILDAQVPSALTYMVACTTILLTALIAGFTLARLQRKLIFHL